MALIRRRGLGWPVARGARVASPIKGLHIDIVRRIVPSGLPTAALGAMLAASATLVGLVAVAPPASASRPAPARIGRAPLVPRSARTVGALPKSTVLHLDVVLQPRDPAELASFATQVSTPGSPLYHHYLPARAFPAKFGPTSAAISAVERSLRAAGLRPGPISRDHLSIPVRATAGRVAKAFSTSFKRYRLGARVAYANTSAPLFSGAARRYVQGVLGLDSLAQVRPAGLNRVPVHGKGSAEPRVVTGGPQPCAAASATPNAYTADQIASVYNFSSLYGAGDEGAGITVALVELDGLDTNSVAGYQSCYGTDASVTQVYVDGGAGGESTAEPLLDVEDVIGLAPKAAIQVYEAPNFIGGSGYYDDLAAIVSADTAQVVSTSWTNGCEEDVIETTIEAERTLFEEAATQGQSFFASAGDNGSEDCGGTLGVDDPASQPYVTGVGGTTLSSISPRSETVWNEGSASNLGAGGGGISMDEAMPWYQSGAAPSLNVINSDSSGSRCVVGVLQPGSYCREVPDVSADADPDTGYATYIDDPPATGWFSVGGTSASAPTWAAFMALADASSSCAGAPIGFANPVLYEAAASDYSSDFNDITSGNNDYEDSNGGLYPAGNGYDMASGLGTPNGGSLASTLCSEGDLGEGLSSLSVAMSPFSSGYSQVGQTIPYDYLVTNTGSTTVSTSPSPITPTTLTATAIATTRSLRTPSR